MARSAPRTSTAVIAVGSHAVRLGHEVTVLAATRLLGCHPERLGARMRFVPVAVDGLGALATAERFRDTWRGLLDQGCRPDCAEAAEFGGVAGLLAGVPSSPPLITRLHTPIALLLERNQGEPIYRDDADRCRLEQQQVRGSALLTSPSA